MSIAVVDEFSDKRWTDEELGDAVEDVLRGRVKPTRERVGFRRLLQLLLPLAAQSVPPAPADGSADVWTPTRMFLAAALPHCQPLTPAQAVELGQAAAAFAQADADAVEARSKAQAVNNAMDYELARRLLLARPDDPQAAQWQAQMAAASPETLDLVARRDAWKTERGIEL